LFGRSVFRGCRHFWRRLLGPGLLASACHRSLLRCLSDLCRSGFRRGRGLGPGNTSLGARGSTHLQGSADQLTVGVKRAPSELLRKVHRFSFKAPQVPASQEPPSHP
jgi:hypothetical protein